VKISARHAVLVTTPLAGLLGLATPGTTPASAATVDCAVDIGSKLPVILVHGLLSDSSVWGDDSTNNSMVHAIDRLPGLYVKTFDYNTNHVQWVTNPNVGPKLARQISCEAAASRAAGGAGKVIVIGHSMGGLAIRFAATQTVQGRPVANDIGLVVTIGTPNLGSGWANLATNVVHSLCFNTAHSWCDEILDAQASAFPGLKDGSDQLKALPWLPADTPTLAIAGDVSLVLTEFQRRMTWHLSNDLVVSKASALQDIRKVGESGGSSSISCEHDVPFTHDLPVCWHSGLPHNPTVEQQVLHAISTYRNSLRRQVFTSVVGDWTVHGDQTVIDPDGRGSDTWNDGPCSTTLGPTAAWCTGHATFQLQAGAGGKFSGIYTRVWFTSSTGSLPPDYTPDPSVPRAGDSFTIWRLDTHTLQRSAAGIGNPYLCDSFAQTQGNPRCGA